MKIRNGFVSNSSSSSFTCSICHHTESGWDLCLSDAGMYRCINDHCFCDDHLVKTDVTIEQKRTELMSIFTDKKEEFLYMSDEKISDEFEDLDEGGANRYDTMPCFCPICHLMNVTDNDLVEYLLCKVGMNRKQAVKEIKEKYQTFDVFAKTILKKGE